MKSRQPFLFSIVLHILILVSLWFWPKPKEQLRPDVIPIAMEVVPAKALPTKGGKRLHVDRSPRESPRPSLRDLLPSYSAQESVADTAQAGGSGNGQEEGWGDGGSNMLGHLGSASELQRLAVELDGALTYPSVLSKRQISGTISARLYFKNKGGCDWKRTKVLPGQPYLRVYIFAVLKKVCSFEQIQTMTLLTSDHADLSFNFRLVKVGEQVTTPEMFLTGNVLGFERQALRSAFQVDWGPLVLFPGANPLSIAVDFGWFVDQWDHWMKGRDPLAEFRD
jgi:hypothetical protein